MVNYKINHIRQSQAEKLTRYSIRKVSFWRSKCGCCNRIIFLGVGSVQAAETAVTSKNDIVSVTTLKETTRDTKEEVKETTQITDPNKLVDETSTDVGKKSEVVREDTEETAKLIDETSTDVEKKIEEVRQDTEEISSVQKVSVSTVNLEAAISNLRIKNRTTY